MNRKEQLVCYSERIITAQKNQLFVKNEKKGHLLDQSIET